MIIVIIAQGGDYISSRWVKGEPIGGICEQDEKGLLFYKEEDAKIYAEELDKVGYETEAKNRALIRSHLVKE